MKCPNCGKELADNARFCSKCGHKIIVPPPVSSETQESSAGDGIHSETANTPISSDSNDSDPIKKNVKFQWKNQYNYAVIIIAIIIAVGAGLAVRSHNSSGKNEIAFDVKGEEDFGENNQEDDQAGGAMFTEQEEVYDEDDDYVDEQETVRETVQETVPETVPETVRETVSSYECVADDCSWTDAKIKAENAGGHLAVITSEEEYDKICKIAKKSGLSYIWLGARIYSVDDEWSEVGWITGEEWTFDNWYPNEPSKYDSSDHAEEFYLCLWKAKYDGKKIGWTFNDQRNDIVADFPGVSGKIGYIIEYEE